MKLLAVGIAMTFATSALGADAAGKMPVKAPAAAPVTAFNWSGCYVGAHVGGGWGNKHFSDPTGFELPDGSPIFTPPSPLEARPVLPLDQTVSGLLGGGQVGCRYQSATNWVVGIDGGISAAQLFGSRAVTLTPFVSAPFVLVPGTFQAKAKWLASATGNIGYAFDRLLLYAKGGAAWVRDQYELSAAPDTFTGVGPADFRASETRTGWTAGAGIEYAFSNNLSARVEYDFYSFGTRNVQFVNQLPSTAFPFGNASIKQYINAITFGLNYYFWNLPASVAPTATTAPSVMSAAAALSWNATFQSEVRYFSWGGTLGVPKNAVTFAGGSVVPVGTRGSGAELYTPYAMQLVGQGNDFKIEMLARGGYVWARQSTAGLTGTVGTATDTVTSTTITYLGVPAIQPFISLDLNLPTGLASLTPTQVNARMDPDLVDVATFGEGLNVGPTIGFNLPFDSSWLLTMSAGYTHRGVFNTEGPLTPPGGNATPQPTNITPGDVFTATGVLGYQTGPLSAKLTGTITENGTTKQDDVDVVRPGRRYLIAGTASYNWPSKYVGTTTLNASAAHSNRNDVSFQCLSGCPTTLVTEPFNTNSNLYQASVQHLFDFGQIAVGPRGSFLFRDNNGYEPTTLQFVPAKERWTAGLIASYAPNQTFTFNARAERVWTHENETPGLPSGEMFSVLAGTTVTAFTIPVISSTGWQFAFGATASF